MSAKAVFIEADIDSPAPELLGRQGVEEVCGVLEVSIGALRVVQHVLAKEERIASSALAGWQKHLSTIREEFAGFVRDFQQKLEESQRIAFEKEQLSLEQYNELLSATLSQSMENVLYVSKRAVMMVYSLDEMMTALASLDRYITDIKAINKQANMLAVNASIEAVRAGQAGQNFAVVATEIKDIAETIKNLSSDMHRRIKELSTMVEGGYGVLQEIATVDLDSSIQNKDKMDALLAALKTQQQQANTLLSKEASEHHSLLTSLDKVLVDMRAAKPFTPPLCNGIDQVATRQRELKKSLEQTIEHLRIAPDMQLADSVAEGFVHQELIQLLDDALSGKEVSLSLAMQHVRRIPNHPVDRVAVSQDPVIPRKNDTNNDIINDPKDAI